MRVFNEMSVRRAGGFPWAGAGIVAVLILALAALVWPAALAERRFGVDRDGSTPCVVPGPKEEDLGCDGHCRFRARAARTFDRIAPA